MNTFNVFFRLLLNHFLQWREISPGGSSYVSCIYYQGIESAGDAEREMSLAGAGEEEQLPCPALPPRPLMSS